MYCIPLTIKAQTNPSRLGPNNIVLKHDTIFLKKDSLLEHKGDLSDGYVLIKGYLKKRIHFKDGRISKKETYHYSLDQLTESASYAEGKLNGFYQSYHKNGGLKSEGYYSNNCQDSLWTFYHDNGKMDARGSFKPGSLDNNFFIVETSNDPQTGLEVESSISDRCSSLDGKWKFYDHSGQLIKVLEFDKGKLLSLEFNPRH